jgi:hypothetical protein
MTTSCLKEEFNEYMVNEGSDTKECNCGPGHCSVHLLNAPAMSVPRMCCNANHPCSHSCSPQGKDMIMQDYNLPSDLEIPDDLAIPEFAALYLRQSTPLGFPTSFLDDLEISVVPRYEDEDLDLEMGLNVSFSSLETIDTNSMFAPPPVFRSFNHEH